MSAFLDFVNQFVGKVPIVVTAKASIPAMLAIVYISKLFHALLSLLLVQKYDSIQASYRNKVIDKKSSWQDRTIARAYNAHSNQWEAFIGFTAAILLALNSTDIDNKLLTSLANAFLAIRLVYNITYILAFNVAFSAIRSSVWTVGIVIVFQIFYLAVGKNIYV